MKLSYIRSLLHQGTWYQRNFGPPIVKWLTKISKDHITNDRELTLDERVFLHNVFLWQDRSESIQIKNMIRMLRQTELERLGLPAGEASETVLKRASKAEILSATVLQKLETGKTINPKIPFIFCKLSLELWSSINFDLLISNEKQVNDFYHILTLMNAHTTIDSQYLFNGLATGASTLKPVLEKIRNTFSIEPFRELDLHKIYDELKLFQDESLWDLLKSKREKKSIQKLLYCGGVGIDMYAIVAVFHFLEDVAQEKVLRKKLPSYTSEKDKTILSTIDNNRNHRQGGLFSRRVISKPQDIVIDKSQQTAGKRI